MKLNTNYKCPGHRATNAQSLQENSQSECGYYSSHTMIIHKTWCETSYFCVEVHVMNSKRQVKGNLLKWYKFMWLPFAINFTLNLSITEILVLFCGYEMFWALYQLKDIMSSNFKLKPSHWWELYHFIYDNIALFLGVSLFKESFLISSLICSKKTLMCEMFQLFVISLESCPFKDTLQRV